MKKIKFLYVFNFGSDDIGPIKHASEVMRNTTHNCHYISNIKIDSFDNELAIIKWKSKLGVFFNLQLFQLICFWCVINSRNNYDVVIVRQSVGFFILNFLLKLFRFKVVTESNGLLIQDILDRRKGALALRIVRQLEYWNLTYSDKIVAVHENIKQTLTSFYGDEIGKKIVVIENGVDLEQPSLPIANNKLTIGYLGSFAHREGVDFLPKVSSYLSKKNIDHEFLMIGGSQDEVDKFRSSLNETQKSRFNLFGYVEYKKAKELLKTCHMFIHLRRPIQGVTDSQGCPLKTLDYLSVGRCVLTTKIESYAFLEQRKLGVLVPFTETYFEASVAEHIAALTEQEVAMFYNKGQAYLADKTWKHQIYILDDLCERLSREMK